MMLLNPIDTGIAEAFSQWRSIGGTYFFINLSELAGPTATAGLALVVALVMFLRRRFSAIAGFAVAVGGANAMWILIKALVDRSRPPLALASFLETGSSFPSGHATNAFAVATFFALLVYVHLPKGWGRTALIVMFIACASLVALVASTWGCTICPTSSQAHYSVQHVDIWVLSRKKTWSARLGV